MIFSLLLALAATTTPTPLPTPTVTPAGEIQKIREVVQQKVMEKLKEITSPADTKRGIVGKITKIDGLKITIEFQNQSRTIDTTQDTVFVDIKRNLTKLSALKMGQDILVLGQNDPDTNVLVAKRIVFIDLSTIEIPKTVAVGKIVDISKTSPIFTLIPSKNKNNLFQIKTDSKTIIINQKQQKIKLTDLASGQKTIVILTPDPKMTNTYYAVQIITLTDSVTPSPAN